MSVGWLMCVCVRVCALHFFGLLFWCGGNLHDDGCVFAAAMRIGVRDTTRSRPNIACVIVLQRTHVSAVQTRVVRWFAFAYGRNAHC